MRPQLKRDPLGSRDHLATDRKYRELSAACLANAFQLQRAARLLYKNGYSPAALALGVTADEEIAKSIMFVIASTDASLLPGLERLLHNHRAKQALIRFVAILADGVGPALRGVIRASRRIRAEAPATPPESLVLRAQEEALRIMTARGRRRRTQMDEQALLLADTQTMKNNCLYAGLGPTGDVVAPQQVASRKLTKTYLAALDNRIIFYTHMVTGNMKDGKLELDDSAPELIAESWKRFRTRFQRRGRNE